MPNIQVDWIPKPRADRGSERQLIKAVWVTWLMKEEAGVVAEVSRPERLAKIPLPMSKWPEQQNKKPNKVVERKDSEGTSDVEVPVPVNLGLAVKEDSRDEEAGQNEEDIDPGPSPAKDEGMTSSVVL